jgi:hypothetical protein
MTDHGHDDPPAGVVPVGPGTRRPGEDDPAKAEPVLANPRAGRGAETLAGVLDQAAEPLVVPRVVVPPVAEMAGRPGMVAGATVAAAAVQRHPGVDRRDRGVDHGVTVMAPIHGRHADQVRPVAPAHARAVQRVRTDGALRLAVVNRLTDVVPVPESGAVARPHGARPRPTPTAGTMTVMNGTNVPGNAPVGLAREPFVQEVPADAKTPEPAIRHRNGGRHLPNVSPIPNGRGTPLRSWTMSQRPGLMKVSSNPKIDRLAGRELPLAQDPGGGGEIVPRVT